jgi:hypothetical protein
MKKHLLFLSLILLVSIQSQSQTGEALNFDGSNDQVIISNPISSILDPLNTITVEAWVKSSNTLFNGVIVGNYYTSSSGMQFLLRRDGNSYAFWVDDGGGFEMVGSAAGSVITNTWQHLAGVWDGSSLYLYIDGVLVGTTTGVNGSSFAASSNPVVIGRNFYPEPFGGSIDEVRIWSRALTQCDIISYKNCEVSGSATGLIANYHFNQGVNASNNSGVTSLMDDSGNSNAGTLSGFALNGATSNWVAPGAVTSGSVTPSTCTLAAALNFDGVDDYAMTGSNITHGNQFTYEAWINPISANQWGGIMTTSSLSGEQQWVQIALNNVGALRVEIVDDAGNNKWYDGNTSLVGAWHHIAVSFDGTNLLFYVDGKLENTSAFNNGTLGTMTVNSQLNIGAERNHNAFFNGDIDEVRVWNVVRTQCEIISYKDCEIPTTATGLVANYHFNQGVASNSNPTAINLADASGSLNTGTLVNFGLAGTSSNWVAPGAVVSGFSTPVVCAYAAGLNFDGANDVVSLPSGLPSMTDMTIETWIYPESISNFNVILNNSNWYNGLVHFQLRPSGELGFAINGNSPADQNTSMVFTPNQWYHIAAVYSSTNQYLKFYVNGVLVDTYAYTTAIATAANAQFEIGGWDGQRFFDGTMDEFRIWNTTRSECEINTYMNCEIPSSAAGLVVNYHFNQGIDNFTNPSVTSLTDASGNSNTGTLNSFALTGSTSNWIAPGAVANGYSLSLTPPVVGSTVTNSVICNGNSTTLSGTGAVTYTWTNGVSDGAAFSPTTTETYTVTGTDAVGCTNTATNAIVVNTLPTIYVNGAAICTGQSYTITPSGADTYTFSNGSDVVMPTADATYTVTGTDANGCENMAIVSVTVNALPAISVNSDAICAGQSFTMVPNGAATYTFSNGSDITMPTADETYTVTGTDVNGCENMAIASVTVNALPVLMVSTTNTLLCTGQTATLSVTGATSYTWNTTETTADIAVSPTTQTTYTVDGTDGNGCANTMTFMQDVSLCTGVAQLSNVASAGLQVYPNPTTGTIKIQLENWNSEIITITLTNAIGQVVLSETTGSQNSSFNLSQVSTGIYTLKAESKGMTKTVRLIKQ